MKDSSKKQMEMSGPIIECVPNFSEGGDKKIVNRIADSIRGIQGVCVLNIHMDPSHNRSVITFVGEPKAVLKAAFEATKTSAKLIDMEKHRGEHPRVGSTDVIPLIPIKNISMEECVKYAKKLAKKIAEELKIPTYLYEKAAKKEDRQNLANIRKTGYEKLKYKIRENFDFKPDFGLAELGKAGATMVGARDFLIAFNVNLQTKDIKTAKEIAKKIRESDGGLKGVKAIGINLEHKKIVQVSTNITDYKTVGIKEVFEAIKKEAEKRTIKIKESEIVGMIPKEALPKNHKEALLLKDFSEDQIIDSHCKAVIKH